MRKKSTRLVSAALAVCMMLSALPVGAFALEPDTTAENGVSVQEETATRLNGGETITDENNVGSYTLSGAYIKNITINTTKDVTIDIDGKVTYTNDTDKEMLLLDVQRVRTLTINGGQNDIEVTSTGATSESVAGFLSVGGSVQSAHIIVQGGHYTSTDPTAIFVVFGGGVVDFNAVEMTAVAHAIFNTLGSKATVNVNGGKFSSTQQFPTIMCSGGTTVIKNAEVSAKEVAVCAKYSAATVEIIGGEYSTTSDVAGTIGVRQGTATITDAKIMGKGAAVWAYNTGKTTVTNCTITNSPKGIWVQNGTVTLENATFKDNESDIYLDKSKTITIKDTFTGLATVKVADDPIDVPRPITTREAQNQDKLNLVSNNVDANGKTYVVAYDADNNYRYLAQRTGYTVTAVNATAATADGPLSKLDQIAKDTEVTLTANTAPEGKEFSGWKFEKVTASGLQEVDIQVEKNPENPGTGTFKMPDDDLIVTAEYQGIIIDPGTGDDDHGGDIVAGVVIGGIAVVGAYEVGTGLYRILAMDDVAMPANRIALAELMWERAGKPEPETMSDENLYSDLSAEDEDAQKAARWAVEQELMKEDDSVEGELKFHPAFPVSKLRVCLTWEKAKQKGLFDQNTEA